MSTDLFSKQAQLYSKYRPQYPEALYRFLLEQVPARDLAWDCATGNGQAAHGLAPHFARVIATDLSATQIQNAVPSERIEYRVLPAEQPLALPDRSVDLITVAQAIHWFDLDGFYGEVRRLLKPGGIIAAWGYGFHAPIHPAIDELFRVFFFETLGPYWKPNNRLLWNGYQDLRFPFTELTAPKFAIELDWTLDDLIGYFQTWSATQLYRDQHGTDPTVELREKLLPLWGGAESRKPLRWDIGLRVGRV